MATLAWYVAPIRKILRNMIAAIVTERPPVRYLWRVLDRLDYWVTQARLRVMDVLYGPLPDCDMRD